MCTYKISLKSVKAIWKYFHVYEKLGRYCARALCLRNGKFGSKLNVLKMASRRKSPLNITLHKIINIGLIVSEFYAFVYKRSGQTG